MTFCIYTQTEPNGPFLFLRKYRNENLELLANTYRVIEYQTEEEAQEKFKTLQQQFPQYQWKIGKLP